MDEDSQKIWFLRYGSNTSRPIKMQDSLKYNLTNELRFEVEFLLSDKTSQKQQTYSVIS